MSEKPRPSLDHIGHKSRVEEIRDIMPRKKGGQDHAPAMPKPRPDEHETDSYDWTR